ncbi:MAG: DNA repair protein RadA, partial [Muribaculaceae bacterium]|nr:DNA repair protein RadA [Muribaculaceae bacterium]
MAKKTERTAWFCSNCGNESSKWEGRCPACGEWNTMVEERTVTRAGVSGKSTHKGTLRLGAADMSVPTRVSDIVVTAEERMKLPSGELNRVLGGGLVPGSMVLVGGEPGIGKSTLVLQNILSIRRCPVLYVSGEESAMQIKLRADRIGRPSENCYIVTETSLDNIMAHIENVKPGLVIVDSIQTIAADDLESSAGSVSQVRECASRLLAYAKKSNVPVILIGHITKEGSIAGPKVLEHIVDAVLRFEGDSHYMYRILRAVKNRFGSTSELGIYEMCQRGLREVTNPSEMLMNQGADELSGVAVGVTVEG